MHRIDTSTAQKDKFGAGKNGFTLGNAQTGVPPTEVSADILDAWQEEICSVIEWAGLKLNKSENNQLMQAIKEKTKYANATIETAGITRLATDEESILGESNEIAVTPAGLKAAGSGRFLTSGTALPTKNIGPIWHEDYGDWMTWQEFNRNGANYTGYASRMIGSLLLDTQPNPRAGYIKSGVQNLSKSTYAALRAWAIHNGLMVSPGVWTAGAIQCADNADGSTFRIYDVRGLHLRAFDDGAGVDMGRVMGSKQKATLLVSDPTASVPSVISTINKTDSPGHLESVSMDAVSTSDYPNVNHAVAATAAGAPVGSNGYTCGGARVLNVALLATIKF